MAWSVTIKTGLRNVVLPNGRRYQAGQTAVLSDTEASLLTATGIAALFTAAPAAAATWPAGAGLLAEPGAPAAQPSSAA
jgi:hypothetical protein